MKTIMMLAVALGLSNAVHGAVSAPAERLGTVSFSESCTPAVRVSFDRGVALLHDFWYGEAQPQFEQIVKADPSCAMAHWGIAMSLFHQIWERPDDAALERGWAEMQAARARPAKTAREREYILALSDFFRPDKSDYATRVSSYSAAMGTLFHHYPRDVDAGAFYALSLLAAEAPDDPTLTQERRAMDVLRPLFASYPDNPGVVHYIIHACDNPTLARDGLSAANHYGEIAASGPHAVHMPGHVFSRLGMWQADIDANVASVAASQVAESRHLSGSMDQLHSDDFLLYAYLQSGQDAAAEAVLTSAGGAIDHLGAMSAMADQYMAGMFPYYRTKFPVFYALERRDWAAAAALEPIKEAPPDVQLMTHWARSIADGHLRRAREAQSDLLEYDVLMELVRKGARAYYAESTGARIKRGEIQAWSAFASGNVADALQKMRDSADLQDHVGQGEVDIPAREMLADMLLDADQPQAALIEYKQALILSPNRFNGLFNAGRAAEAAGDRHEAESYYAALVKSTRGGIDSTRGELEHAKAYMASRQ